MVGFVLSGMGRWATPTAKKIVSKIMAGVVNSCRFCGGTVYDEETTYPSCPRCYSLKWLDWPREDTPDIQKPPVKGESGYHVTEIPQGTPGELSKILEEVHEAIDADAQNNPIMVLQELSDIYGAIDLYLKSYYLSFTMEHLAKMSEATHRAFSVGKRKRKNTR